MAQTEELNGAQEAAYANGYADGMGNFLQAAGRGDCSVGLSRFSSPRVHGFGSMALQDIMPFSHALCRGYPQLRLRSCMLVQGAFCWRPYF